MTHPPTDPQATPADSTLASAAPAGAPELETCAYCGKTKAQHVALFLDWKSTTVYYCHEFTVETSGGDAVAEFKPPAIAALESVPGFPTAGLLAVGQELIDLRASLANARSARPDEEGARDASAGGETDWKARALAAEARFDRLADNSFNLTLEYEDGAACVAWYDGCPVTNGQATYAECFDDAMDVVWGDGGRMRPEFAARLKAHRERAATPSLSAREREGANG